VLKGAYFHKPEGGGKNYYWEHEVEPITNENGLIVGGKLKADGTPLEYEMTTMSKSKNNGVDPQDLIDRYGADTARLFVMFASPPEQTLDWNDAGVDGAHRFLKRVWEFPQGNGVRGALEHVRSSGFVLNKVAGQDEDLWKARREAHLILKQIASDYERMQYNTVVSGCMKLLNLLERVAKIQATTVNVRDFVIEEGLGILLRALYPACPHITQAMWDELGYAARIGGLLDAPWPAVDDAALVQDEIELMLQVNGKLRGAITVPASADKAAIEAQAAASAEVAKFAEGKPVKKIVVVPGRLVNVVV
jgi:leucyl-tRNA synthetase